MTDKPIIELDNITVVYNAGTPFEVEALKDFSLRVAKGEIIVITGGNGSGKSTLLRAIMGTAPVQSGKILINGKDIKNWSANKRAKLFGAVHQDTMLGTCPNLTIQENFQLTNTQKWWQPFPYVRKLNRTQIESIKNTGLPLESRETSKVNMLSGGQRQAIAVCLAFQNQKPILLFDEFTSALDDSTLKSVLKFTFNEAKINNLTLLMVMHNAKILEKFDFTKITMK